MRVCIQISTGKLIEAQSLATAGTLRQNALNLGYADADIDEHEVDDAGWVQLMAAIKAASVPDQNALEIDAQTFLGGVGCRIDHAKLLKAKMISDLAFRLGVAPGALTGAQLLAERNRIAAIYKAL